MFSLKMKRLVILVLPFLLIGAISIFPSGPRDIVYNAMIQSSGGATHLNLDFVNTFVGCLTVYYLVAAFFAAHSQFETNFKQLKLDEKKYEDSKEERLQDLKNSRSQQFTMIFHDLLNMATLSTESRFNSDSDGPKKFQEFVSLLQTGVYNREVTEDNVETRQAYNALRTCNYILKPVASFCKTVYDSKEVDDGFKSMIASTTLSMLPSQLQALTIALDLISNPIFTAAKSIVEFQSTFNSVNWDETKIVNKRLYSKWTSLADSNQ